MATIVNTGGGITVTKLASLTSIPKTETAVSGTENWIKYNAFYFVMRFNLASTTSVFTSVVFSHEAVTAYKYNLCRQMGQNNDQQAHVIALFADSSSIKMWKSAIGDYDVTRIDIYGINF